MYELHDVIKSYGEGAASIQAVDGISLSIKQGEFVVVEGPSGSGKSTLLQLLGALDRPSAGSVMFEGQELAAIPDRKLADLRLKTFGFVFQQFNLVPTLSALENVMSALAPLGGSRQGKKERALRLLGGVGLSDRAGHLPSQLSGGEQQRVAIARALSKGPRVILADEPTGNLDTRTGQEIMTTLRRLSIEMGQTVVLITHDSDIAASAPRVVRIRDGKVAADASGAELALADTAQRGASEARGPTQREEAGVGAPAGSAGGAHVAQLSSANADDNWIDTHQAPQATARPLLHAEGVVKHYVTENEDVVGVDGVSLIVHEGEFVAITGPSGSGKTTLLNCLSGLDRIDRGRVLIDDHTIHEMTDKEQSHLRAKVMGFIFQNWNLVPVFSAVENVELPLLLNGATPATARAAAAHTLERIGLGHRLNHHPNALSGGEQQRVAIARALAAGPKLLWADEPSGNLDSHTAESVMELFHELNQDGLAIVLVTHDESIADQAMRRIYIRDGKLLADMTRRSNAAAPKPKPPSPATKVTPEPLTPPTVTPEPAPVISNGALQPAVPDEPELETGERRGRQHGMTKAERRATKRTARMSPAASERADDTKALEFEIAEDLWGDTPNATSTPPPEPKPAPPPEVKPTPPPAPKPAPKPRDPSPSPRQSDSPMQTGNPEPVRYDDPF